MDGVACPLVRRGDELEDLLGRSERVGFQALLQEKVASEGLLELLAFCERATATEAVNSAPPQALMAKPAAKQPLTLQLAYSMGSGDPLSASIALVMLDRRAIR